LTAETIKNSKMSAQFTAILNQSRWRLSDIFWGVARRHRCVASLVYHIKGV